MRRFVIGDVHGCAKALRSLIEAIDPSHDDELVFLGDYIDRGPNSRDVIQQILELRQRCHVVALRGNHEIMLLGVALGGLDDEVWMENGGVATVTSYGGSLSKIPADHLEFFQRLEPYYETAELICVHAGYQYHLDMHEQDSATIYWKHLPSPLPPPHKSGKRMIVGHTPQSSGNLLDAGHVICVDTYCFGGGFLTAFETNSYEVIQADRHGHLRRDPVQIMISRFGRTSRWISRFCRERLTRLSRNSEGDSSRQLELPDDESADVQIAYEPRD